MDSVSALSLAGSIVGIIGVISKSINVLHDLRSRWKESDLTVTLLIAQLTTLKAALNQISGWISSSLAAAPQHHQLIIDLEASMRSCSLLIMYMDRHISKLEWNEENAMTYESRIRVVLEDKAVRDCVNHLNNQTNALNLLLTAFSCQALGQKALLESKKSRQIFGQVRDDSSSLLVLQDSASFISSCTEATGDTSKLSIRFPFDGELLQSKIYQGTVRSLFRRVIQGDKEPGLESITPQSTTQSVLSKREMAARSREIDNLLANDRKKLQSLSKLLVLGAPQSGKSTILRTLKRLHEHNTLPYRLPLSDRSADEPGDILGDAMLRPQATTAKPTTTTYVPCGDMMMEFVECGADLRKMIHQFEGVRVIVFVVDLSSYDQMSLRKVNRMAETLHLFEFVSNSRWLPRGTIILLLNKMDLFREKLAAKPLQDYFPSFRGENQADPAAEYITSDKILRMRRTAMATTDRIDGIWMYQDSYYIYIICICTKENSASVLIYSAGSLLSTR